MERQFKDIGTVKLQLFSQGHSSQKLQTTFRKFYDRHADIVHKFGICVTYSVSQNVLCAHVDSFSSMSVFTRNSLLSKPFHLPLWL